MSQRGVRRVVQTSACRGTERRDAPAAIVLAVPRSTEAPLLAPELHKPRSRVSYSFPDVVALRTFVYLRSQKVPLQRVRKAAQSLRDMGATEHLSSYQLVAVGRDVVWKVSDDVVVDLTRRPGQQVIAQMVRILDAFRTARWYRCIAPNLAWR